MKDLPLPRSVPPAFTPQPLKRPPQAKREMTPERARIIFHRGYNSQEIADAYGLKEHEVVRLLDEARRMFA